MNEKDFGAKLRPWLDRSAAETGDLQSTRLRAARLRALDAYREPVRILGLVTVGAGTVQTLKYGVLQQLLLWLPLVLLIATLAAKALNPEVDIGELDAQSRMRSWKRSCWMGCIFGYWRAADWSRCCW